MPNVESGLPLRENIRLPEDEFLLETIPYEGDQSPEFDALTQSKKTVYVRQEKVSELISDGVICSEWHVPCHCIIAKTPDGKYQGFHVQPNKMSASLLSWEQEQAMQSLKNKDTASIVAKGERSWFGNADLQELKDFGISHERTIHVATRNWWRPLYDPATNEIWIDIKD